MEEFVSFPILFKFGSGLVLKNAWIVGSALASCPDSCSDLPDPTHPDRRNKKNAIQVDL
jgi:hypothetical protein